MRPTLQIIDGILNRSRSQKRTERGKETSELLKYAASPSELLSVDIIDSQEIFEFKRS
jgi:hypothetical protein